MSAPAALCDVSVLVRTVLRPSLPRAVRSVFSQDYSGAIQILVGVDAVEGDRTVLDALRRDCPARMRLDILEMPTPTSRPGGGVYTNRAGGSLPVVLAYAANAQHIVFLDDDNWAAPDHLSALRQAVEGFDWAYTLRWFADSLSGRVLCADDWESLGPAKGVFARRAGGFVDLNCLMIDKVACHFVIPSLAIALFNDGTSSDRSLFLKLREYHSVGWTGRPTVYYAVRPDDPMNRLRRAWLTAKGIPVPDWPEEKR